MLSFLQEASAHKEGLSPNVSCQGCLRGVEFFIIGGVQCKGAVHRRTPVAGRSTSEDTFSP